MTPRILVLLFAFSCTPASESAPTPSAPTPADAKPPTDARPTDPPAPRSKILDPASFDTRCTKDDDCIGIETVPCRKCGCVDAAIAASDRDALTAAIAELACEPGDGRKCKCASLQPWCDAGKCAARPRAQPSPPERRPPTQPQSVDLSKYDLSCKRDTDCTNVRPSVCGRCGCASTPLRAADNERFHEERAQIVCADTPDPHPEISCGACPGYTGVCKKRKCAIEVR